MLQESQLQKNLPDLQSLNLTDRDSQRDEMLTHLASTLKSFMLTCQEWEFTRGELFQRTKELGSTKQYAKKLFESWGDWLKADSIEEEEEEEEERKKVPTDAVEGSAPTDDEEKDEEKELLSQLSKKTAAVKEGIEEGSMAVVDVPTDENIISAAEEADGNVMEIDKMSGKTSELPTNFTSTSSSAASSAEPSTSSSASSSNPFSSADYDQIEQVSDKLFSSFPRENDFSVIVLCLYVQALRTHFMTQKFFETRLIYRRLHKVETYQQHRNVLCKFLEGDITLEDVSKTFPKVSGIETISNALRSMFKGRALTILQNMQLPTKPAARKGLLMLALNAINKSISDFLEEKLMTP